MAYAGQCPSPKQQHAHGSPEDALGVTLSALRSIDAPQVAALHRQAFPGFFLSSLGTRFLTEFYRGFVDEPTAVTVVARSADGGVLAAAVGTTDPPGFFTRLLRRRFLHFFIAAVLAILRAPHSAPRLLRAVRYRGGPGGSSAGRALLSSIWVTPTEQRTGLGRLVLTAWLEGAARAGAVSAFLTTDADGNEAANAFYASNGWRLDSSYTTPEGRRMNVYTAATRAAGGSSSGSARGS